MRLKYRQVELRKRFRPERNRKNVYKLEIFDASLRAKLGSNYLKCTLDIERTTGEKRK